MLLLSSKCGIANFLVHWTEISPLLLLLFQLNISKIVCPNAMRSLFVQLPFIIVYSVFHLYLIIAFVCFRLVFQCRICRLLPNSFQTSLSWSVGIIAMAMCPTVSMGFALLFLIASAAIRIREFILARQVASFVEICFIANATLLALFLLAWLFWWIGTLGFCNHMQLSTLRPNCCDVVPSYDASQLPHDKGTTKVIIVMLFALLSVSILLYVPQHICSISLLQSSTPYLACAFPVKLP